MHLTFLGTGAAGGTPGEGRSNRRESSMLVDGEDPSAVRLLLDVTRDVEDQLDDAAALDAVLLTHGHRDASGGMAALDAMRGDDVVLPVHGHERTLTAVRERRGEAAPEHLELRAVAAGEQVEVGVPWRRLPSRSPTRATHSASRPSRGAWRTAIRSRPSRSCASWKAPHAR